MSAHTTADDPTKYRLDSEEASWIDRDPLVRLEKHLRDNGLGDEAFFEDVSRGADEMAHRVRQEAMAFPVPRLEQLFDNVYAGAHPLIQAELQQHLEYEAGFLDRPESDNTDGGAH